MYSKCSASKASDLVRFRVRVGAVRGQSQSRPSLVCFLPSPVRQHGGEEGEHGSSRDRPHLASSHERKRLRTLSEATVGLVRVPQPPIGCGTVPGACSLRKPRRSKHTWLGLGLGLGLGLELANPHPNLDLI